MWLVFVFALIAETNSDPRNQVRQVNNTNTLLLSRTSGEDAVILIHT